MMEDPLDLLVLVLQLPLQLPQAIRLHSRDITVDIKKNVYAVAQGGKESAAGGQYQVDHAGWVGVTTYIDTMAT